MNSNNNLFISTSCIKNKRIGEILEIFIQNQIFNIELSGGSIYYDHSIDDIFEVKRNYPLNFICHNYFPPPKTDFVLNLASSNEEVYNKSLEHYINAINLSKTIGSAIFSIHAGFLTDISVDEIGRPIRNRGIETLENAINRFCNGYTILECIAKKNGISLYIENNVFSLTNSKNFSGVSPFLLLDFSDFLLLKQKINFNLLLDLAHLKITCKTLNLNLVDEFNKLWNYANYLHISENDGMHDSNGLFNEQSEVIDLLKSKELSSKIITLEIYEPIPEILVCKKTLQNMGKI